jgi:hypothetical protein
MTPKAMKSNDSNANRAQIERAGRLDRVPDEVRFPSQSNDFIGLASA